MLAALAEDGSPASWHTDAGILSLDQSLPEQAESLLRKARSLGDVSARARRALAAVLIDLEKWADAETEAAELLIAHPDFIPAHDLLARIYAHTERIIEAAHHAGIYAEARPQSRRAQHQWFLYSRKAAADEAAARALESAVSLPPDSPEEHSGLLYLMLFTPGLTSEALRGFHQEWRDRWSPPAFPPAPRGTRMDTLRVAVCTSEFRISSAAGFVTPLLRGFHRSRIRLVCYHTAAKAAAHHYRPHFDEWHDLPDASCEDIARRIRGDDIDVLLDIAGHHHEHRLAVFASRPARLQYAYPRYPSTTGLDCFDGLFTDRWTSPAGTEAEYSEPLARLPGGYLAFEPPPSAPGLSPLPLLTNGHLRLGLFQQPAKLHAEMISAVAEVLRRLPESRLVYHHGFRGFDCPGHPLRRTLTARFQAEGVPAHRLEFVGELDHRAHMELAASVDLALDAWPYNGQTTTCECLYMGVPVVTMEGERHAARVGRGLLLRAGLPECIASDVGGYVSACVNWAAGRARLVETRAGLRERLRQRGLLDGSAVAGAMEAEFRRALDSGYQG